MAKSAFLTFIKTLFSPGFIEISSFTMAAQAFEVSHNFSYFLPPINEISVFFASSSSSGAVIWWLVFPKIVPFKILFISLLSLSGNLLIWSEIKITIN